MDDPTPGGPRRRSPIRDLRGAALFSTIGFTLVIASAIGTFAGYWVDERWHTSPWGIAIGFLFGTAAGFIEMFRLVSDINHDDG